MKLYIITDEPFPSGMASTNRITCYAKSLIMQGMECEIIIYHRTERYGAPPRNTLREGLVNGIHFTYIGETPLRDKKILKRKFFDYNDKKRTLIYLKEKLRKGDVVLLYARENFVFTNFLIRICKKKAIPILRELCEYPFCTRKKTYIRELKAEAYFKFIFPQFNGMICISDALFKLARRCCSKGNHIKVPILVENQTVCKKFEHPYPYIFHGGTLLERKDAIVSTMKAYIMACNKIKDRIDFILAGPTSPHIKELTTMIRCHHLENRVLFLPQMSKQEIASYQSGAFLNILNKNDNTQNRYGFSTKLGEILISETPVITTTVGEANHWLVDGESAYIVPPHHPELIAEKIVDIYENREKSNQIAKKGKEIAEKFFNLNYQGHRIHNYFKELSLQQQE